MDKLSDFLPLIIIIGSVIISIVQSSKKKKTEQDMKKTMLPKGIPTERPNRPVGAPVVELPKMKSFTATAPSTVQEKKAEIGQAAPIIFNPEVNRSVSNSPLLNEAPEVVPAFTLDVTNTDELKRAVIYSEILHRKEY